MSVPIATVGLKPKTRISIGVIREPPPMPVMPTSKPISRPASDSFQSISALQRGLRLRCHPDLLEGVAGEAEPERRERDRLVGRDFADVHVRPELLHEPRL